MFRIKMLPGQEEYTPAELEKVNALIKGACEAEEQFPDNGEFGYYELEEHAKKLAQKKTHPGTDT